MEESMETINHVVSLLGSCVHGLGSSRKCRNGSPEFSFSWCVKNPTTHSLMPY